MRHSNYLLYLFPIICSFLYSELTYPINNQSLHSTQILFQWDQEIHADSYNIEISTDENFENKIIDSLVVYPFCKVQNNLDWESDYYWRVMSLQGSEESTIGNNVFNITEKKLENNLEIYDDSFSNRAIAVGVSNWAGGSSHYNLSSIIDLEVGEIWNDGNLDIMLNNISAIGEIFGGQKVDWTWTSGTEYNLNHDIVFQEPESIHFDHHDFQKNSQGNYMGFTWVEMDGPIPIGSWSSHFQDLGYSADGVTNEFPWVGQMLVEVDPNSNEVVWSWNPFDFYTLNDYDEYGGTWQNTIIQGWNHYDWLHSNSFYFDEENNHIYISHRHLSRIVKIDYETGDIIWTLGPSVDYMYSGDEHICSDLGISFQHHVQRLENGNLLIYDNGNLSQIFRNTEHAETRILEVDIENSCEIIFEYIFPSDWTTWGMGSVEKLDNNNYLISSYVEDGILFEINQEKEIIWKTTINKYGLYRAFVLESIFPKSFDIFYKNLISYDNDPVILLENNNSEVNFDLCNQSENSDTYIYTLGQEEYQISIPSNQCETISLTIDLSESISNHVLSVYPATYPNLIKEYYFSILKEDILIVPTIYSAYPNPSSDLIKILYYMPRDENIDIVIYDLLGRELEKIESSYKLHGYHTLDWNCKNYSSGEYFIRIFSSDSNHINKIILIK